MSREIGLASRPGPNDLFLAAGKRLTPRGHGDRLPGMIAEMGPWLREGRIVSVETVVDGLENASKVFIDVLRGANTGKMLVRMVR